MTDIQKKFCEEYIVDFSIKEAAIRAGYKPENAHIVGWQVMQSEETQKYINELRAKQQKRTNITADKVQSEIARLAFSDLRDYYDDDGLLLNPKELSDDAAAALAEIAVDELYENRVKIGVTKKIKLYDKLAALDKLARRLGMYEKDNKQRGDIILHFDKGDDQLGADILDGNVPED